MKTLNKGTFPERLKFLRKKKNVSQRLVGEFCGLSQAQIDRYENGRRQPRLNTLVRLADYFGVSLDYLCGRE